MSEHSVPVWPSHDAETLPWQQTFRAGTREDRMLRAVSVSIPPTIQDLDYLPPLNVQLLIEDALMAVARADTAAGRLVHGVSRFMIRAESAASSRLEHINATTADYAAAISGYPSSSAAISMVAASNALSELITAVSVRGRFHIKDMLSAHRTLMCDDPYEVTGAGVFREVKNWIGGSDDSPRNALYVPPAPERVAALMDDLVEYLNRDDVPVMVQAAIGHAQFESIHPFTDGNGRIGRALVAAVLWRRGVTHNIVMPLSFGLFARRDDYFAALGAYRVGDPTPIVALFVRSTQIAAEASRETITRLKAVPAEWVGVLKPRAGSAVAALIPAFCEHQVMSASQVLRVTASGASQTYKAVTVLTDAGFILEVTGRQKNRVWVVLEIMAEVAALERRIKAAINEPFPG